MIAGKPLDRQAESEDVGLRRTAGVSREWLPEIVIVGVLSFLAEVFLWYAHAAPLEAFVSHFAYVPITLAAMWWSWRGTGVAIALALSLIPIHVLSSGATPLSDELLRGLFFVLVSGLIAFFAALPQQPRKAHSLQQREPPERDGVQGAEAAPQSEQLRVLVLAGSLLLCFSVTYYAKYVLHTDVLYTHLYYVPIVLAAMWWAWRGLIVALVLVTVLLLTHGLSRIAAPFMNDVVRGTMSVVVGSIVAALTDARRRAELALRVSEQRHRALFRAAPVALWEADWSAVRPHLAALALQGVSDFTAYLHEHAEALTRCAGLVQIIDVNDATLALYGAPSKQALLARYSPLDTPDLFVAQLAAVARETTRMDGETIILTLALEQRHVAVRWSVPEGFDRGLGKVLVSMLDITDRKRMEETVREMAYRDQLTGLPNRLLSGDRLSVALAQASRRRGSAAVMLLDLDYFKEVNDTLGHGAGDQVLKAVGARLTSALRTADTVARLGGDEFIVLLPEIASPADAERVARKLNETVAQPLTIEGHELRVTLSIGIAIYPQDGQDPDTLVRRADEAMYAVKREGRNGFKRYLSTSAS